MGTLSLIFKLHTNMMDKLSNELENIKSKCIGLFQHRFTDDIKLIIEADSGTITIVSIGNLFVLITSTISQDTDTGNSYFFPDGLTLSQMMSTPKDFLEWYAQNLTIRDARH